VATQIAVPNVPAVLPKRERALQTPPRGQEPGEIAPQAALSMNNRRLSYLFKHSLLRLRPQTRAGNSHHA